MALAEHPEAVRGRDETLGGSVALDRVARAISVLADYGFIVACVELLGVARSKRSAKAALLRLAVVGGSVFALNTALKKIFATPRPETAAEPKGLVRIPTSASFPSGHTMAAAAAAVAIPDTPAGIAVGLVGAGAVGWSRLHLGAHHKGDVAGGLLIGAGLGLACRAVLKRLAP